MRRHHPEDGPGWRAPGCGQDASPVVTAALERFDVALTDLTGLSLAGLAPADVTRLLEALTAAHGRLAAATGRVVREADRRRLAEAEGGP